MKALRYSQQIFILFIFSLCTIHAQRKWEPTNGIFGGSIISIAENASGVLFIGTGSNGVFKSTDDGATWIATGGGANLGRVTELFVDDKGNMFAVTDNGIYRSSDDCNTWDHLRISYASRFPRRLAMGVDSSIYGCNEMAIYRSTDYGDSFAKVLTLPFEHDGNSIHVDREGTIYCGCSDGIIFRSSDSGNSWSTLSIEMQARSILSICSDANNFLYAGGSYLYRSMDKGMHWEQVNNSLTPDNYFNVIASQNNNIYASSHKGIIRSTDEGTSWQSLRLSSQKPSVKCLLYSKEGNLFAGTGDAAPFNNGLYRSIDQGDHWELSNNGIEDHKITSIYALREGSILASTDISGIFKSFDKGKNWTRTDFPATGVNVMLANEAGVINAGGAYHSNDNGNTWKPITHILSSFFQFTVNTDGSLYAATNGGVYRSSNFGLVWLEMDHELIRRSYCESITHNDRGHLFVTTHEGVCRSTNNGIDWQRLDSLSPNNPHILFFDGEYLYAASRQIFRSSDDGMTWSAISDGLVGRKGFIDVIRMIKNSAGHLFVGTTEGEIFRSTNKGLKWELYDEGLPGSPIRSLAVDFDDYVYVGMNHNLIYRSILPTTSMKNDRDGLQPQSVRLYPNIPNPFSTTTKIVYSIPNVTDVHFRLMNFAGEVVRTYSIEQQTVGMHEFVLDAAQLPSGTYFIQLLSGTNSTNRHMIILK